MTTIRDYAHDLVLATIKALLEKNEVDFDLHNLTDHEIDDLVDEFIDVINIRMVG